MARHFTCIQGHVWELPLGQTASTTGVEIVCPVCGAAANAGDDSGGQSDGQDATLLGFAAQGIAEVETVLVGPESAIGPGESSTPQPPSSAESVATPRLPAIPGYEILDELGRGGMGVVLKARQTKLDRLVALKVLPAESGRESTFSDRFSREARALAKLSHPSIVMVHDFGEVDGQSYIVMEFIAGMNLRQRLQRGRLSVEEVLAIMTQLCDALQYAHDEGIIHRDIKPENILLDKQGRVRIADFGLAKLTVRTPFDYTLTGPCQVMGTWNYMAPEQLENPLGVDHRADVYSLGVVFYEMLTGEVPRARFPLPSEKGVTSVSFDDIVLRALARDPDQRYQQINEFKTALDSIAAHGSAQTVLHGSVVDQSPETTIQPEINQPPLRPIAVWIVAALCVILWPVGMVLVIPLGIWCWLTLRQPQGKFLFKRRVDQAELFFRAVARNTVGSTTAWAMFAASIGVLTSLVLFSYLRGEDVVVRAAVVPALAFSTVILFHVAIPASFRNSIRAWRAVLLLAAGAVAIASYFSTSEIGHYLVISQGASIQRPSIAFINFWLGVQAALAVLLLFLGSLQARRILIRREEVG